MIQSAYISPQKDGAQLITINTGVRGFNFRVDIDGNVATVYVGVYRVYLYNPSVKFKLPKLPENDFYLSLSNSSKTQIHILLMPANNLNLEGKRLRKQKTWSLNEK